MTNDRFPKRTHLRRSEYRILSAWAEEGTGVDTARRLNLSISTVKNAMTEIRRITGGKSTAQVLYWLGSGQLDEWLPEEDDDE